MKPAKTETINSETGEIITNVPVVTADMGMVSTILRAELDTQIATAKAYPRSIKAAIDDIMSLATLDEEAAADCIYALPRGGKPIRGASVRFAEIIAPAWRNNRVDARVIAIDRTNKVIVAEGTFHDLETNSATRSVVQRRISDKRGRIYNDDMIVVTGNAACAIARRNAILTGVPKAVWRRAYEAAERVVAGDIKTLATRRESAIKAFATYGVKPEQVFAALEIKGLEEITLEHIPTLQGMFSALKNGETTVEEMFDPRRAAGRAFEVVENPLKDEPESTTAAASNPPTSESAPSEAESTDATRASGPSHTGGAGDQAAGAASSSPSQEERNARAPDAKPEIARAYDQGKQARAAGHSRKAMPGELRSNTRTREALAWEAGWNGQTMPEWKE